MIVCLRTIWAGLIGALLAGTATSAAAGWELRVCADPDNMPFSNQAGDGFDNKIAVIIARELGADITWVWLPDTKGRTRQLYVQGGACDMVMGVIDGQPGFLTSYAYYRTGYVFLYPETASFRVTNLNDPVLRDLLVGFPGGAAKTVPPSVALANRGIVENQRHFIDKRDPGKDFAPLLEALGEGKIDLAIAWGPLAGAYAEARGGMIVAPVKPEIDAPFIPMVASLTIGLRPSDEGLRDDVDLALSRGWDEIHAVLTEASVPLIDLPPPAPSVEEGG
ncbi:MAG: transporter substrate-binding domain-containing protein [Rhodobacteraceae bacterium]|nr:transporter substrate-binding domain-containing protein [Paracoccaceae bacterium]